MVSDKCTVLILAKRECQAFERLRRAVPDELVREPFDRRPERVCVRAANDRIDAVRADDQVTASECVWRFQPVSEHERHADALTLALQETEQREPPDRAKAVAVNVDRLVAMNDALDGPRLQ